MSILKTYYSRLLPFWCSIVSRNSLICSFVAMSILDQCSIAISFIVVIAKYYAYTFCDWVKNIFTRSKFCGLLFSSIKA